MDNGYYQRCSPRFRRADCSHYSIEWSDGHVSVGHTPRRLLKGIGDIQFPPMSVKEIKIELARRCETLLNIDCPISEDDLEFLEFLAKVGFIDFYVG